MKKKYITKKNLQILAAFLIGIVSAIFGIPDGYETTPDTMPNNFAEMRPQAPQKPDTVLLTQLVNNPELLRLKLENKALRKRITAPEKTQNVAFEVNEDSLILDEQWNEALRIAQYWESEASICQDRNKELRAELQTVSSNLDSLWNDALWKAQTYQSEASICSDQLKEEKATPKADCFKFLGWYICKPLK